MADISVSDIKALRDATGAGMMDAKKALTEAGGDMEEARQLLREKGLAKAATRSDRDNAQGAVAIAVGEGTAALVHLKSETDFAAKSEEFQAVVEALASSVLADGPDAVEAHRAEIEELQITKKENIELGKVIQIVAGADETIDTYLHRQDGLGTNGVVVVGKGVDREVLHNVALHIAFAKPLGLSRDDVDPAAAEAEREALLEITKNEGKPEAAWEKIVDGRLAAWFGDQVLLEQGLHGDKTSVQDSLGGGTIVSFDQAYLGG